ncbi:MAG: hypothetical protein QM831_35970 [Kofleriaceae bacterium]
MADALDRILDLVPELVRRIPSNWQELAASTFRRDITSFEFRYNDLLEALGFPCRTWPNTIHIPGKLAFVKDADDAPEDFAIREFLQRGGTLVVEGREVPERLELGVSAHAELPAGPLQVSGPAITELGIPPSRALFWADEDQFSYELTDAVPLVECPEGTLVSRLSLDGGTVIYLASGIHSYSRDPKSDLTITPAELATLHGISPTDRLASSEALPRDLFFAELAMTRVFAHVAGAALQTS